MATGDFDNDGKVDLLVINRNARAQLFRNTSPDKNNWITVKLVGTKSNRDGAGARLKVKYGNTVTYSECRLGSSYASTCDKRLHFGLGKSGKVDEIWVLWPSGQKDHLINLGANKSYVVTEGKGHAEGW